MSVHHYEVEILVRDQANNEHREHLELSSAGTSADTLAKAAQGAAKILASNQNGGFGVFTPVDADR